MKKRLLSVILAFLLIFPAGPAFADTDPPPDPPPASQGGVNRYIVQFTESISDGFTAEKQIGPVDKHLYAMELDDTQYQQLLNDSRVAAIHPDGISHTLGVPNDPHYTDQWNLSKTGMADAWDIETGSADVVVAVIDTGAAAHPDLTADIVTPYDAVNGNTLFPNYANGGPTPAWHGTFVSGIIAARTGNAEGVAGMAPGVGIMPVNVFEWDTDESDYAARDSSIIDAIYYAINHGADVINMSLGGAEPNPLLQQAINDARAAGIVVFAAAGNGNSDQPVYPASYEGVISVAATDASDQRASFSSYGSAVDLCAPGADIIGLDLTGYHTIQGTSCASSMAASLAALLLSCDPALSPAQVESIMKDHAVDLGDAGWDSYYGAGRIDAYAALSSYETPVEPLTVTELSMTLTAGQESPRPALTDIALSAAVSETGAYEYLFESKSGTGDWETVRDWDADNTCTWTPGTQGDYTLRVSVRPVDGETACDTAIAYTVTAPAWNLEGAVPVSAGETSADLGEPGEQDIYSFTPAATGTYIIRTTGDTDTYGAVFDDTGALIAEEDNGAANFTIQIELTAGSDYTIGVRHAGDGTGPYTLSIQMQTAQVESVALQADPADSCDYNVPVRLTAAVTDGDAAGAQYQFLIRKSGLDWQIIQDFSEESACTWTPGEEDTYDIRVYARNSVQESVASDTIEGFTATDIMAQEGVALATDLPSGQEYGTPVTMTATPQGDTALTERAEYRFYYKCGNRWTLIQDWSDSDTCVLTAPKQGSYILQVQSRTAGRTGEDAYATLEFTFVDIPMQPGVTLTVDKPPVQETGTEITLTAQSTADEPLASRAEYMFKYKLEGAWTLLQDWSGDNTCTWVPDAKGTYRLRVYTRTAGRSGHDITADYIKYVVDIPPQTGVALGSDLPSGQEYGSPITLTATPQGDAALGELAEYRFSYKYGNKWTLIQDFSDSDTCVFTAPKQGSCILRVQSHTQGRTGEDASATLEFTFVDIPMQPGVNLTVDKAPVQEAGTEITLTGQTTADGSLADRAEYQFQVKLGKDWTLIRDWSGDNTCTWVPDTMGKYTLRVYTRTAGRGGYDIYTDYKNYVIDLLPQEGVTLATDLPSGQEYGTPVTLIATPQGDAALTSRVEYRFYYKNGGRWQMIRDWGDSNTCVFTAPKQGSYILQVQSRTQGRTGKDTYATLEFTFADIPRQPGVTLTTDKSPVQEAGTEITLTGQTTADGPLADRAEYRFQYKLGGDWTVIQDWSGDNTCTWVPDAMGTYRLRVYTRTAGRSGHDKYETYRYKIDVQPLTGVTVTTDAASPQQAGSAITISAVAAGLHADNAEYLFRVKTGIQWTTLQDWSNTAICTWTPDEDNTYTLEVQARAAGRSGADATAKVEKYVIYAVEWPLASLDVTVTPGSPQEIGTPVQIRAQAGGDSADGTEQYLIRIHDGSQWTTLRDWSTGKEITWTPGITGAYTIEVQARAAGRSGYDVIRTQDYTVADIPPQTGVTLATDLASGSECGAPVTMTATPQGDTSLTGRAEYCFYYKNGLTWVLLQDWIDSNTCVLTPAAAGTYTLEVQTRTKGRELYDTYATIDYVAGDIPQQPGVTLTPDKPAVQEAGTEITLTAQTTADGSLADRAEYLFQYKLDGDWTVLQDWSDDNTCAWVPDTKGAYTLRAYTRTAGRIDYDKYTDLSYVVDIQPLTGVSLTADAVSPQQAGTMITLSAEAAGLHAGDAEYLFRVKTGLLWTTLQDWSDASTCAWTPVDEDTYTIEVLARSAGRSGTDATASLDDYFIFAAKWPLTSLDVTVTPGSPQEIKTPVLIRAQAGGESADGTEQYLIRIHDGSQWTTLSDWSTVKEITWTPGITGAYTIEVQARSAGRSGYDVIHTQDYTVVDIPPQVGVTLATDLASGQEIGAPVTLTATPQGDTALTSRAEYCFYYKNGLTWELLQNWSDSNTCVLTPSAAGTYTLEVQTRTKGRDNYDTYAMIEYVVGSIPQQPGVTLIADKPPIQETGTEIVLTAQSTAGAPLAARAEYQFQYKLDGSWTVLRDWSSEKTCTWIPDTKGTYTLRAYTRTAGRINYDRYVDMSYVVDIIPLTRVTMTANPAGPSLPETLITFTAAAEGVHADTCEYRFTFYNGKRWYTGHEWSTVNSFVLSPSYITVYNVIVEARSPGRTTADVTYTINYAISLEGAVSYTYSDDEMAQIQSQSGLAVKSNGSSWVPASFDDILYYVNPDNWLNGANKYQFLSLNYTTGITAADLDAIICDNPQNGGKLHGKGSVFLAAAQQYDINPAYLVSHALLETGNGSSVLATGYNFNGTTVYNMFGICAYDSNPNYYGGQYAYNHGWTTVDKAITGGTEWIADHYIHSSSPQNTLYSMRWNPNAIQNQIDAGQTPHATHQYATDVAWAVKQVNRLKSLMDRCVNAVLEFIIPDYD